MEKAKGKIKAQIIKGLEAYKGNSCFIFFDDDHLHDQLSHIELDANDVAVLLMNLNDSDWILLTTKCLFIRQNGISHRINGFEIEEFKFLNVENGRSKEKIAEFRSLVAYKSWLYSGNFKITRTDYTEVIVKLPHHDVGFCLFNAIKKLRFVATKYVGI